MKQNKVDIFQNRTLSHILNVSIIFIVLLIIAIVPLQLFPKIKDTYPHWLTSSTVKFTNNWLKDGAVNDKFIMWDDFKSVETTNNRVFYVSYPPGTVLPAYAAAKLLNKKEIDFNFVKKIVKLEYYSLIFLIAFIFYFCLEMLGIKDRLYQITIPVFLASLWSFLPYNYYHLRNVFFSDQLVILYAAIFFLLEFYFYYAKNNKWQPLINTLTMLTVFMGCMTDYYFYTIIFVASCIRIMNVFQEHPEKNILYKIFSQTWQLILPFALSIYLFVIQLNITNGYSTLYAKFIERTISKTPSITEGFLPVITTSLNKVFPFFPIILIAAVLFCIGYIFSRHFKLKNDSIDLLMKWEILVIFSAIIHTLICKNHSMVHEFSMMKYNFVCVFILFGIFVCLYLNFRFLPNTKNKKILCYTLTLLITIGINYKLILSDNDFYKERIHQGNSCAKFILSNTNFYDAVYNNGKYTCAKFLKANTDFFDAVYSPDFEIPPLPPQAISISEKRVYHISKISDIPINNLPKNTVINILLSKKTSETAEWEKIQKASIKTIKSTANSPQEQYIIYKIPYNKFLIYIEKYNNI